MAITLVDIRKIALVKIQSVVRSYNTRDEISYLSMNALTIQVLWRGYSTQLSYQFQIVDIIIVQNIFRQKAATIIFKERLYKKRCNSILKKSNFMEVSFLSRNSYNHNRGYFDCSKCCASLACVKIIRYLSGKYSF